MACTPARVICRTILGAAALMAACGSADGAAPEAEIYPLVLERVRAELQHDSTMLVHPLMATANQQGAEAGPPVLGFNVYDPDVIPKIVAARPGYSECELSKALICQVAEGEVAIVLSEIIDLEVDGRGMYVVVHDRRSGGSVRYHAVRVKRGWRAWDIVQFSPMDTGG